MPVNLPNRLHVVHIEGTPTRIPEPHSCLKVTDDKTRLHIFDVTIVFSEMDTLGNSVFNNHVTMFKGSKFDTMTRTIHRIM